MAKELWVEKYLRTQSIMCLRIPHNVSRYKIDYRWWYLNSLFSGSPWHWQNYWLGSLINELNVEKADVRILTQAL